MSAIWSVISFLFIELCANDLKYLHGPIRTTRTADCFATYLQLYQHWTPESVNRASGHEFKSYFFKVNIGSIYSIINTYQHFNYNAKF